MRKILLVVASLWSVCTASHAQDRAECERIVHLVAEAVGAGSIEGVEPFLAPGFMFSGQEGDRARSVMKLLVEQLDDRVERIEMLRAERTERGLELVCAFTYAGALGRKEATFLFRREKPSGTFGTVSDAGRNVTGGGRRFCGAVFRSARRTGSPARQPVGRDGVWTEGNVRSSSTMERRD